MCVLYVLQGHIETIFDCQFHPDDPDVLATGSFDGTIKIWDMTSLKPVTCDLWLEKVYFQIYFSGNFVSLIFSVQPLSPKTNHWFSYFSEYFTPTEIHPEWTRKIDVKYAGQDHSLQTSQSCSVGRLPVRTQVKFVC